MVLGVPSVMTSGTTEMPVWCADNWDILHMVYIHTHVGVCTKCTHIQIYVGSHFQAK